MQKLRDKAQVVFCRSVNKQTQKSYADLCETILPAAISFLHKDTDFSYTFEVKLVSRSTTSILFPMDLCV